MRPPIIASIVVSSPNAVVDRSSSDIPLLRTLWERVCTVDQVILATGNAKQAHAGEGISKLASPLSLAVDEALELLADGGVISKIDV